ncbi:ATP-binding protein [Methylococcaceae bacterium WWC4]|nr:ATP-binding protein [Methylococcaceae bacterium WWC4]
MAKVYLIEGPVGAGKSTYSKSLAAETNGIYIALDEWFTLLFGPDRPDAEVVTWYLERKDRVLNLIWKHAGALLASGIDVVLELGLIQRADRQAFYRRIVENGFDLRVFVLSTPENIRRRRVQQRNVERGATFFMVVSGEVFDLANRLWEPPDERETSEYCLEFVSYHSAVPEV